MKFAELISRLEAGGFFGAVPGAEMATVRQEIHSTKFLFPKAVARLHPADAEDLSEQGALEFIVGISPQLAQQGIHLPVTSVPCRSRKTRHPETGEIIEVTQFKLQADGSIPDQPGIKYLRPVREEIPESGEFYKVTIGSRTQEIWNRQFDPVQCWEAGMCHTFILVNQLLQDAGSPERIYGLYGGNDGFAIFLTPLQFDLIRACEEIEANEMPWEPYVVKQAGHHPASSRTANAPGGRRI